jgi:hypothetical protein
MVVVENLTKAAHFIPVKLNHKAYNIVDVYLREIARLHGIINTILSNRDPNFASNFWKGLFKGFGTNIHFSTAYYRESDGKKKGE